MAADSTDCQLSVETSQHCNFDFSPQFTDVHPLSHGSSGMTFSAYDKVSQERVAIKRLTFCTKESCQKALREIKIIKRLKHENVVKINQVIGYDGKKFTNEEGLNSADLQQALIVTELLDADLHSLIQSKEIQADHVEFFMYQLLRGLNYIHSMNIVHRDLRPCNILVNCETLMLKIADFGISRIVDKDYSHKGHLSPRLGSHWYWAPEQILIPTHYDHKIDVWAAGCVLAEMVAGRPLFMGKNDMDQMCQILDAVFLQENDWSCVLKVMPNKLLKNHPFKPRHPLGERLRNMSPTVLDLLEKLLQFSASDRVSCEAALSHPLFSLYHGPDTAHTQPPLRLEHEVDDLSPTSLKTMIFEEGNFYYEAPLHEDQQQQQQEIAGPVHEDTHTLDEILMGQRDIDDCGSMSSSSHCSVEDLNMRNLRNSQENLSSNLNSSYNILQLSKGQAPQNHVVSKEQAKKKPNKQDSEEKEEADISPRKLLEDQELEIVSAMYDELEIEDNEEQGYCMDETTPDSYDDEQQTGNLIIDQSTVDLIPRTGDNLPLATSPPSNRYDIDDVEEKERKILEMEESNHSFLSKVNADTMDSEKRRSYHPPAHDMDDMYRLPTEHLRNFRDRDYSNERLKHRRMSKIQMQRLLRYRYEINELNERLREDGACGGEEGEEGDVLQGNTLLLEASTNYCTVMEVEEELGSPPSLPGGKDTTDGGSSPDEHPSSPRQLNTGARPKKSPRKQKAL